MLYPIQLHAVRDPLLDAITQMNKQPGSLPREIEPGVFQFGHWNPEYYFATKVEEFWRLEMNGTPANLNEGRGWDDPEYISDYGVCDGWEQLDRKYPRLRTIDIPLVITLVELRKEDQEPSGGWRWHKWGEYVGEQDPQCEYLYDEPVIESAWTYHIYKAIV